MNARELQDCGRALDIEWPVSSSQLKGARNLQAQVWHPDRFHHDERLRVEAEEKLKRVNVSFERLTILLKEGRTAICDRCRTPVKDLTRGVCEECAVKEQRKPRTKAPSEQRPRSTRQSLRRHVDIGGRWQNQTGWVEFSGEGPTYRFTEWGLIGQVGDGTATVSGNTVTLRGRNVVLGNYMLNLSVNGPMLTGAINVMGIPLPYQLWRA